MGVELSSESGEQFQSNSSGWRYLTEFAGAHGFRWPATESGEEIDALDAHQAAALANAVEQGIGRGTSAESAVRVSEELTNLLVPPTDSPMFKNDPLKFEERTIDYWKEFIRFARCGGFTLSF